MYNCQRMTIVFYIFKYLFQYQKEFMEMESLSDKELWKVAESKMPSSRQRWYSRLLRKNQAGTLRDIEKQQLADLGAEARKLTLRKAHAYAVLKWRGHRIPTLAELCNFP